MKTLIVRHVDQSDPAQFQVVRLPDGKTVGPVVVPSPVAFSVAGRPNSDLMRELRWYLEGFLDYPFPPETDHAERLRDALKAWGQQAFLALFDDRATGRLFDAATSEQYGQLQLRISSDDPRVLYWPWEALRDPEAGVLARTCQVQRQLNRLRDPHPLSDQLPQDRARCPAGDRSVIRRRRPLPLHPRSSARPPTHRPSVLDVFSHSFLENGSAGRRSCWLHPCQRLATGAAISGDWHR